MLFRSNTQLGGVGNSTGGFGITPNTVSATGLDTTTASSVGGYLGTGATSDPLTVLSSQAGGLGGVTSTGALTGAGTTGTNMGMTSALQTATAGLGLASAFGLTPNSGQVQTATDPFAPYRGSAASNLNNLMTNPQLAMATPGYQVQLGQGLDATARASAAGGQLASGGELAAANALGQNTFSSYYNTMLGNLMQMSGADRKSTRLNSSHIPLSRMPSSA